MIFKIEKRIDGKLGRAGIIATDHGEILTPAFMCVGTGGIVRFVSMEDLHKLGAQAMLSNGYHLRRKSFEIAKAGGLAKWSDWDGPTLTDSGGFQVMSLGSGLGKVVSMELVGSKTGISETASQPAGEREAARPREDGWRERRVSGRPVLEPTADDGNLARVTDEGVYFTDPFDGAADFIGPEESMQIQCRIGADIHMAFDELTSIADDYDYNVKALARTEAWAERSLREHLKHRDDLGYRQNLYGVLQGGRWEDLRRATARTMGAMSVDGVEFDGFGLGGAFLKEDLGDILKWCNEELPEEKPRHLLGLSRPEDILCGVENGADTFDCVAPTREARHGRIYTRDGNFQLRKFMGSSLLLEKDCDCETCRAGWTRGALRELWKSGDVAKKQEYYRLASVHNLRFIVRMFEEIRVAIIADKFEQYKKEFLLRYFA